jgi:hypothetical protein
VSEFEQYRSGDLAGLPAGSLVRYGTERFWYVKRGEHFHNIRPDGGEDTHGNTADAWCRMPNSWSVIRPDGTVSRELMSELPIGAVVGVSGMEYTQLASQQWRHPTGATYTLDSFPASVHYVRFGEARVEEPQRPRVGSTVVLTGMFGPTEQGNALPVGTIVEAPNPGVYRVRTVGGWERCNRQGVSIGVTTGQLSANPYTIVSYPADTDESRQLLQLQRELTECIDQVVRDQGTSSYGAVRDIWFARLGLRPLPEDFKVTHLLFADILPEGTVLVQGSRVMLREGTDVQLRITDGRPDNQVIGNISDARVIWMPEAERFTTAQQFIDRFYPLVNEMQVKFSWCSAVHHALERCDLDQDSAIRRFAVRELAVGDVVTDHETVPLGAVLTNDDGVQAVRAADGLFAMTDLSVRLPMSGTWTVAYLPAAVSA